MAVKFEGIWAYQFRIVLLGDSTVGKSALLRRFTDGCYIEVRTFIMHGNGIQWIFSTLFNRVFDQHRTYFYSIAFLFY